MAAIDLIFGDGMGQSPNLCISSARLGSKRGFAGWKEDYVTVCVRRQVLEMFDGQSESGSRIPFWPQPCSQDRFQ